MLTIVRKRNREGFKHYYYDKGYDNIVKKIIAEKGSAFVYKMREGTDKKRVQLDKAKSIVIINRGEVKKIVNKK